MRLKGSCDVRSDVCVGHTRFSKFIQKSHFITAKDFFPYSIYTKVLDDNTCLLNHVAFDHIKI